jgi:hypothetical protein
MLRGFKEVIMKVIKKLRKIVAVLCSSIIFFSILPVFPSDANEYTYLFDSFNEATALSDIATVLTNETLGDIEVYGSSGSDCINPAEAVYVAYGNESCEGGIWWNGKTSNANRYIKFTPLHSGTIVFRIKNVYNKNSGTKAWLTYGTGLGKETGSLSGLQSQQYQERTLELEANTTYYFWPTGSGVNISDISFEPETATTSEPKETIIPLPETTVIPKPEQTLTPLPETTATLKPEKTEVPQLEEGVYMYSFEDFVNDTPLTENGITLTKGGGTFIFYGAAPLNEDYINPVESPLSSGHAECKGGVWWNGARKNNKRYFEFTPAANGKLTITLCGAYSNAVLAQGTTVGTKLNSTPELGKSYTTYTVRLTSGTTYYFWPENTGVSIYSLEYDTRNIPVPTNEPVPTVEPVQGDSGSITPLPTKNPELSPISEVDTSLEKYDRYTLNVDDKPFFYNGVQIRIDKCTDAYHYTSEELRNLFRQAKEDGFTVVNSQIRWTDIQPEVKVPANESTYIKNGVNADTNYFGENDIVVSYSDEEDLQGIGYIKYDLSALDKSYYDGIRMRIYINSAGGENALRLYGITDNSWDPKTMTWNSGSPNHGGYTVLGEGIYDLGTTPEYDPINKKQYYDFDVTDFINRYCLENKVASFMLRTDRSTETSIRIDGVNGETLAPQLIVSDGNEYDWTWLDQAIGFAEEFGLKFEVLWFGTDTVSISMDGRVPYYVHRNYQKSLDSSGAPFFKKNADPVYGVYYYLMCKNDLQLRKKEREVVQTLFNHIAEYNEQHGDKKTVIGCQVANEPAVGRLHGAYMDEHCKCNVCIAKRGNMTAQEFRDQTMWEYCNNIATAVKESNYSVWTRVNNFDSTDASGVAYNEKVREASGTNIDFIGHDTYNFSIGSVYDLGHTKIITPKGVSVNYAQGKNLPMIMENGGNYSNAANLTLAALAGGSFYNVYDLCSTDKWSMYDNSENNELIPSSEHIEAIRQTNKMLNKLAPHLATKKADGADGEALKFFNELSNGTASVTKNIRAVDVTYNTDNSGVGIAIDESPHSIVFASVSEADFVLNGLSDYGIESVTGGYYDENGIWIETVEKEYSKNGQDITVSIQPYECVRIAVTHEIEELVKAKYEFESLNYTAQNAVVKATTETGYSGAGWSAVTYSTEGGYVEYTFDVSDAGRYAVILGTKEKNNRVTAQIYMDGEKFGNELIMNGPNEAPKTCNMGQYYFSKGQHTIRFTAVDCSLGLYGGYDYLQLSGRPAKYDNDYDLTIEADGQCKLYLTAEYHGQEVLPEHIVFSAVYTTDGTLKNVSMYDISGSGAVQMEKDSYLPKDDEEIKIFVWGSTSGMRSLSRVYTEEDIYIR